MTPLRGGVIGCGFFAQFHLDAWRRMPDAEIVCACDPDLERAAQAAPRTYASVAEMFRNERLDFVDIATRPETHRDLVEEAASHGVAVICQKPLAPTWVEAVATVKAAEAAGIPFMVHENWRWQPWYREVGKRIAAGDIGAPVTYRFRIRKRDGHGDAPYAAQPYFRRMPRLLIYETMVHPLDTARFLFGDIERVMASGAKRNPVIVGEDFVQILVRHASGLDGIADGHRFTDLAPDSPPLGDASFEGDAGVLEVLPTGDLRLNGRLIHENRCSDGYRGDSVRATQQNFIDGLLGRSRFETGGRDYLGTVAAVEAGYLSMARGAAVNLSELVSQIGQ
ncbi:MAG: Gfo/Idh/MocA family oxidoreductase [Bryobacteraceae bacterium]